MAGKVEFKLSRLDSTEWVGMGAALLLAFSLLLPWFATQPDNENSTINEQRNPDVPITEPGGGEAGVFTAFQTFTFLEFVLLAACLAPFVLAWIVVRGHQVGWNRGEVTAIVGAMALTLILLNGLILGQPGDGAAGSTEAGIEVSLTFGYPIAILAAVIIVVTGALRGAKGRKKTPPGV